MTGPTTKQHLFVGADPDLHRPSVAMVNASGQPVMLHVGDVPAKYKAYDAARGCLLFAKQFRLEVFDDEKSDEPLFKGEIVAAAIEGQEIYRGVSRGKMKTGNPADLLNLAPVTGILAMRIACAMPGGSCFPWIVKPREWKGGVPKKIHQARVFSRIGWKREARATYQVPTNVPAHVLSNIERKGDWKHVGDAIGLALYARDRYYKENGHG